MSLRSRQGHTEYQGEVASVSSCFSPGCQQPLAVLADMGSHLLSHMPYSPCVFILSSICVCLGPNGLFKKIVDIGHFGLKSTRMISVFV